jgi:hypothetical protein
MILSRLGGMSVYAMRQTGNLGMDDNTTYRFMNNPPVDWKSMLPAFARQLLRCASEKGEPAAKHLKNFEQYTDTEAGKSLIPAVPQL